MSEALRVWGSGRPVQQWIDRLAEKAEAPRNTGMAHKRHRDELAQTGGRS